MSCRVLTREYSYANTPQNPLALQSLRFAVFDGLDVVQERDNNNRVTAQLVRDGNINGILSRVTNAGAAYYGYDGNGNVTLLTDANGSDVGHYRYDAFGQTLEAVGPRASENPYRFSTKPIHERSGLIDFGFRFYSPGMGRWMNRDPLQEAGGINLYAMVGNNPVNDVDEYGLHKGWKKKIDEWLFGKPKNYSSDEDGEVQRAVGANQQVKKTGPKAWKVGANVVMTAAPFPVPKALPAARIPKAFAASKWTPNAAGRIVSFVSQKPELYYRVYSAGGKTSGAFLTKVAPRSAAYARNALALPPSNSANMIQLVLVPAGTRLQRSRAAAAFGRRGGAEQFELLNRIPATSFGRGVPLR